MIALHIGRLSSRHDHTPYVTHQQWNTCRFVQEAIWIPSSWYYKDELQHQQLGQHRKLLAVGRLIDCSACICKLVNMHLRPYTPSRVQFSLFATVLLHNFTSNLSLGTDVLQQSDQGMALPRSHKATHIFGSHGKRKRNSAGRGKNIRMKNNKSGPVKLPKSLAALIPKKYRGMMPMITNWHGHDIANDLRVFLSQHSV